MRKAVLLFCLWMGGVVAAIHTVRYWNHARTIVQVDARDDEWTRNETRPWNDSVWEINDTAVNATEWSRNETHPWNDSVWEINDTAVDANEWTRNETHCAAHPFTCTPSGLHYRAIRETTDRYGSPERICAALQASGLRRILFCGDSYVRHAFEGLLLILSGDYEHGAMVNDELLECVGEAQFEEKHCRFKVPGYKQMCGGAVEIHLSYHGVCSLDADSQVATHDVVVWGFGNHPYDGDYERLRGVYDAPALFDGVLKALCLRPAFDGGKVIFLHNHARLNKWGFAQQSDHNVREFANSVGPLLRQWCGITRIVDAYNLTATLLRTEDPAVVATMTHDGAHWSRTVNVVKGWMLIHEMISLTGTF